MMTINEKLIEIRDHLDAILKEQKEALISKNITLSEDVELVDIPELIRSINAEDIRFIIDFSLIDQVGSPHTPRIGQAAGGFEYDPVITIDTNISQFIRLDFSRPLPSSIKSFKQGHEGKTSDIKSVLNTNLIGIKTFNFKTKKQVPEVINYVDQIH